MVILTYLLQWMLCMSMYRSGLFLPLLIGLLLLYPWLAGSRRIDYSQENQDKQGELEKKAKTT